MERIIKAIIFDCFGVLSLGNSKNTQLLGYIKDLKTKGLKIGLLSNVASDWITREFLNKDEKQLFDDMALSYQLNIIKPNPQIFKIACERLNVSLDETLLIDDSEEFCEIARRLGMKSIHYIDFNETKEQIENLLNNSNN